MGGRNWVKVAEERLERGGWLEAVAGRADWNRVVSAFVAGMRAVPKRGALLAGAFGCGKTMAVRALYRAEGMDGRGDTYSGLVLACSAAEDWAPLDPGGTYMHGLGWLVLDDMGAEALPRADRADAVGERVTAFHRFWSAGKGGGLAVTTNLTGEQMAARYGGRVMSRLMEMVVPVALEGGDKRRRVTVGGVR